MIRIATSSPAPIRPPSATQLKARLATLDTKIAAKTKELTAHKEVMMRSRYTAEGLKVATAKLKTLERELGALQKEHKQVSAQLAKLQPKKPSAAQLTAAIEKNLKNPNLEFNGKAPKKEDILTQTEVNKRPFSYTAIVLKSDPTHVIIKKVLTGGFVPAQPGAGVYTKPLPLS